MRHANFFVPLSMNSRKRVVQRISGIKDEIRFACINEDKKITSFLDCCNDIRGRNENFLARFERRFFSFRIAKKRLKLKGEEFTK